MYKVVWSFPPKSGDLATMSMEEDIHPHILTLDDTTEDDFILSKYCGKKKSLYYKSSKQE